MKVEGERFLIGTGTECQLMVGDPKAGPLHAYFEVGEGGRVALHDLGSESGTYVNGERVEGSRMIDLHCNHLAVDRYEHAVSLLDALALERAVERIEAVSAAVLDENKLRE